MMKTFISLCCLLVALSACQSGNQHEHQHVPTKNANTDTTKGSPPKMAMGNIGKVHLHINYNSPAVRNRIIWGGLVPFGEVWVTGAHQATNFDISEDVIIAGQPIAKGKYGFFTIPGPDVWTLILNKNWDQHLTDEYSPNDDVYRWQVKPNSSNHTERLTYTVTAEGNKGTVRFNWEKLTFAFDIVAAP